MNGWQTKFQAKNSEIRDMTHIKLSAFAKKAKQQQQKKKRQDPIKSQ